MVTVATTGKLVILVAVNEGMFAVPPAARPIAGVLFAQAKVDPVTGPVTLVTGTTVWLHHDWFAGTGFTTGVGYTLMVKVVTGPGHPFAVGVIVTVAITVAVVMLVAVNAGMFPVPFAARPIEGVVFAQAKVVPVTGPEIVVTTATVPLQ